MSSSKNASHRTLLIGLDAADADLIEQWCAAGVLPNIARMKGSGSWARLETTASKAHASAWASIFTGTTPDKHGLYHAYVARPGTQGPVRPEPDKSPFPFFWKVLSDEGRRCVVMDAFMTCPLDNFNGSQIVDWGSWSHFWETTVIPAALRRELEKKFGPYPAEDHSQVGITPPTDFDGFYNRLQAAITRKTEVVRWLMAREDWDLFLVVFGEAHAAGHYFWHFHDPSYPTHPADRTGLRSALREVYVALDRALGEILKDVIESTTVILTSGDGMGANYSASHMLVNVLNRMSLFTGTGTTDATQDKTATRAEPTGAKTDLLQQLRNMIPERVRIGVTRTLLPRSVQEKLSLRWKTAGIVWNQTRAFPIENSNEGFIRINLRGREPEGIVEPGKEYAELCEHICRSFKSMTANGLPAARTVYKTDEIYNGPCRPLMPDVIVNWNDDARITTELSTEQYGIVTSPLPGCAVAPFYTGNHRPAAFVLSVGPGVRRGSVYEGASILDLAPTVLKHFGISPPKHMDGKIRPELCGSEHAVAGSPFTKPVIV